MIDPYLGVICLLWAQLVSSDALGNWGLIGLGLMYSPEV